MTVRRVGFATAAAVALFTGGSSFSTAFAASATDTPGSVPFPVFKIETKAASDSTTQASSTENPSKSTTGASPSAQPLPVYEITPKADSTSKEIPTQANPSNASKEASKPAPTASEPLTQVKAETTTAGAPAALAVTGPAYTNSLLAFGFGLTSLGLGFLWLALAPGRLQMAYVTNYSTIPGKG